MPLLTNMDKKGWLIFACFIFSFGLSSTAFSMDWPVYHGPNRDRISPEKDWRTNWDEKEPQVLWTKPIGFGFASMSVVGNRVFATGNTDDKDTVWCFDTETGDVIWSHTYDCELFPKQHEGGPGATPTVHENRVYTASKQGQLFCLDAKTGEVQWQKDLPKEFGAEIPTWRFSGSVIIEENMAIIDVGLIIAFDRKTGEVIWKTQDYGSAYSTPLAIDLNGTRCIAALPKFGLVLLNAKDGAELGKFEWETRYGVNATTPIVHENKIFLSCGYNKGGALLDVNDKFEISQVWFNRLMRNQMNTSVLWNGYLYGFDESTLKCISFETGEDAWKERSFGKGSLMIADGKLIILGEKGELAIAQATETEFTPLARKQILSGKCWTVPVLSHGKIFARNAAGDLTCLSVR